MSGRKSDPLRGAPGFVAADIDRETGQALVRWFNVDGTIFGMTSDGVVVASNGAPLIRGESEEIRVRLVIETAEGGS